MAGTFQYKCPCCGGAIEFNAQTQTVKCPYCDTEYSMETLEQYDKDLDSVKPEDMEWQNEPGSEWSTDESSGMRVYVCESCGGQVIADENTAATSCPYCGNPIVMKGNVGGDLKPDYVIPFRFDKKSAMGQYQAYLSGKRLLPKVFKDQNHIEEMKGIYVPFWIFDAKADAQFRFKGIKRSTRRDNQFQYQDTDYYNITRAGNLSFEHVPVDGSSKMEDTLMQSIEPFDFKDAVPFQTAYLAGYLADRYDVKQEDSIQIANERIKESTTQTFASTVTGYNSVEPLESSIQLKEGSSRYALYPVWILNTKWNDEFYTFAMNGQTGKFVGNLPVDKAAYRKLWWKVFGISSAVVYALSWLLWFFM